MAPQPLSLRSLNLDLTRNAGEGNSFLTTDPIPPITSAMILNGSIMTEDISDAQITGTKIAAATIAISNMANVGNQTFQEFLDDLGLPDNDTITSAMILNGTIETEDISDAQITGAKIASDTIMNDNISSTAAISGSKIAPASESDPGVVTTGTQIFSGLKTFVSNVAIEGDFTSSGAGELDDPLSAVFQLGNHDSANPYGLIDVFVKNTHATNLTNLIVVEIPINTTGNKEVSSYYEITLIGTQPITAVATGGGQVSGAEPVAHTTRCLLTVTGIEVTTTFLGRSHDTEPFVSTRLLQTQGGSDGTTNLLIGVGFRLFTAYHVKGLRVGLAPKFHFITDNDAITTQGGADALLAGLSYT